MLIDSHVNLHAPAFAEDREAVIARAREAGVRRMLTICDTVRRFDAVHAVAQAHEDIWCTVGSHPHEAAEDVALTAAELISCAKAPRVVAIGECGLDNHYRHSPPEAQRRVFLEHVAAARETGLPLVIHSREADAEIAELLEAEHARGPFRMLLHCYTGGMDLMRRAAALGAFFSVSGILTFKAAEDVRAVVREMPGERILAETDCPYLAPVPFRGRRAEPAMVREVIAGLASVRGWTAAEAEQRTADAFFALFDRIPRPVDAAPVEAAA